MGRFGPATEQGAVWWHPGRLFARLIPVRARIAYTILLACHLLKHERPRLMIGGENMVGDRHRGRARPILGEGCRRRAGAEGRKPCQKTDARESHTLSLGHLPALAKGDLACGPT